MQTLKSQSYVVEQTETVYDYRSWPTWPHVEYRSNGAECKEDSVAECLVYFETAVPPP